MVLDDFKIDALHDIQLVNEKTPLYDPNLKCNSYKGYQDLPFDKWRGLRMGCNCTDFKNEEYTYFEGSCSYLQTMKGCATMTPVLSKDIETVKGNRLCVKRYNKRIYQIPKPSLNTTTG